MEGTRARGRKWSMDCEEEDLKKRSKTGKSMPSAEIHGVMLWGQLEPVRVNKNGK